MYAFKLSGENAAAVALVIRSEVTLRLELLQLVQTKTWFGESVVSEMTDKVPSGETASTFPATLVTGEAAAPEKTIKPLVPKAEESTPR